MRLADLDLREMLAFEPKGGVIRFAGQRTLLFDAVALGLLRKELIETLGQTVARGILTRLGYAHGWRTAETLRTELPWDSEREWQRAGARLHMLQGMVVIEQVAPAAEAAPAPFAESTWLESYEAEQHLLHLGRADQPVCWTLTGYASGYLSYCNGREVYFCEDRCRGRGDAACHVVGRFKEDWGPPIAAELPFYRKDSLDASLRQVTDTLKQVETRLRARKHALARAGVTEDPSGIVAHSDGMLAVLDLARRVAQVDSTVLVTGESGVGKERIARLMHDESPRAGGPFIAVNCGAISETLLESELFGHARGAFTGATQDRAGLFEAAAGGTLLLDELGEVSPTMQVKLLRALQEREIRRVGENKNRSVDVRIVGATNRDLAAEVKQGHFRQDLYYRLRVVELRVPPLRERRDDILPLARVLLAQAATRMGRKICSLSPAAADQLLRHAWPGNVRELENAMERAIALTRGSRVELEDLPEEVRHALPTPVATSGVVTLAEVEREYIQAALKLNGDNRTHTAAQLGIGPATLYRKLKSYRKAVRRAKS
jgi:DNA-binding NtrC family response regulator